MTTTIYTLLDSAIASASQLTENLSRLILSRDINRDRDAIQEVCQRAVSNINRFFGTDEPRTDVPPVTHPAGVVAFRAHGGTGQAVVATPVATEMKTEHRTQYSTEFALHVPTNIWHKLSNNTPAGKTRATGGLYVKGGRNNQTIIVANAVTNVGNYQFIPFERGRLRLTCRQLAKLLRVSIERVQSARFDISQNGPNSLLIEFVAE